jgi:hypothetical protein
MLRSIQPLVVSAAFLCFVSAGKAAELSCSADRCIELINQVVAKTNQQLVATKKDCTEGDGFTRCYYRSGFGPGLSPITKAGSQNAQTIVMVDQRGLSPAGGVYIGAVMEALDSSLNAEARKPFYNQLLGDFASSFEKGGVVQKSSAELKYILSTDEKFTIFGVSHVD